MSVPTNTYQTYQNIGIREDLSDVITNIDPTETPFLTMAGKRKPAKQAYVEWQTDALRASADNKQIEGDDATAVAAVPTVRLGNYCQIFREVAQVSDSTEAVDRAGRNKEMAYQMAKKMAEIKLDRERAYTGINNAQVAGNASTARESASFNSFVVTNTSGGSGATAATGDGTDARSNGTARAFTETLLTAQLQSCWTNGAKPTNMIVGAVDKGLIAGFSGNADNVNHMNTDKKIINSVTVYEGDYHTLKVVPSRELLASNVLLVDPSKVGISTLRPFHVKDLAKTGDSERKMIIGEETLVVDNEKAHGAVYDTGG